MTFVPAIPLSGYAGFKYLERTMDSQQAAHDAIPQNETDIAYFRENIGNVDTAEELVNDYRLLRVALGAFGLDEDIGARAFIQEVLEEGVIAPDALANKLTDSRYKDLATAFGFDLGTPSTKLSSFADDIIGKFSTRSFEASVGAINDDMRLALNAQRELAELATDNTSEDTRWLTIVGTPPLKAIFEQAYGLPSNFGALDIDRQVDTLKARSEQILGSADISQFANSETTEKLVQRFLMMGTINNGFSANSPGQTALMLLGAIV